MAATHPNVATWTTTAGFKIVTYTPAVNDLIVVVCACSGRTTAQAPTVVDNNPGGAGSYTLVASRTKSSSADSMWVFIRNSLITNAGSTVYTMTPVATDTGGGLDVFSVSGATRTGAAALRQTGGQDNVASGTPSITMGSAILTANPVIGAVNTTTNGTANSAPPTGWTEATDVGYLTPANGLETAFRSSGETLTTIAWTAAAPSAFSSVLVEIDLSAAPPSEGPAFVGGGYYGFREYAERTAKRFWRTGWSPRPSGILVSRGHSS